MPSISTLIGTFRLSRCQCRVLHGARFTVQESIRYRVLYDSAGSAFFSPGQYEIEITVMVFKIGNLLRL